MKEHIKKGFGFAIGYIVGSAVLSTAAKYILKMTGHEKSSTKN